MRISATTQWFFLCLMTAISMAPTQAAAQADEQELPVLGQLGGYTLSVAADDNFVYGGIGPQLTVLEMTSPGVFETRGRQIFPLNVHGIWVEQNLLYVTSDHLYVVDISDPDSPTIIGEETTFGVKEVVVAGDLAYVS